MGRDPSGVLHHYRGKLPAELLETGASWRGGWASPAQRERALEVCGVCWWRGDATDHAHRWMPTELGRLADLWSERSAGPIQAGGYEWDVSVRAESVRGLLQALEDWARGRGRKAEWTRARAKFEQSNGHFFGLPPDVSAMHRIFAARVPELASRQVAEVLARVEVGLLDSSLEQWTDAVWGLDYQEAYERIRAEQKRDWTIYMLEQTRP